MHNIRIHFSNTKIVVVGTCVVQGGIYDDDGSRMDHSLQVDTWNKVSL